MNRRSPFPLLILMLGLLAFSLGGLFWGAPSAAEHPDAPSSWSGSSEVYTPAHGTAWEAVREFFGWRPKAVQPIAFSHAVHLGKNIACVACHVGVNRGPVAGLPSVNTCMVCHGMIAADRPEIKKVAAYASRGEDIAWQRVYGFTASAHVKFNHAPHIRAQVACPACHGDLSKQSVAVRAVNLSMGYCLDCHREKSVSLDCVTCHY